MVFVFWDHDEKALVRDYCNNLSLNLVTTEEDKLGWGKTQFSDIEDCKSQVSWSVMKDEFIGLLFALVIQFHFVMVLFTHYKNAHLAKEKGGCGAPVDPTNI